MAEVGNHLENILRIMNYNDFDEETMRHLNMYVASRGLLENYYSELESLDLTSFKREIDKFLDTLPALEK